MKRRLWLINLRGDRTQEDVACEAKLSRPAYTQIELGTRNPSVGTAKKIAKVLGFNWTLFFEEQCHETEQKTG